MLKWLISVDHRTTKVKKSAAECLLNWICYENCSNVLTRESILQLHHSLEFNLFFPQRNP